MKWELMWPGILVATSLSVYYSSLHCGFAFDDTSAIVENKDLRPSTPVANLFWNDFWGTPMHKERSHKSYRPLCVFTFRLNYMWSELAPWSYHLVNVLLHAVVCVLFYRSCQLFLCPSQSAIASLLFTVHPVHTEAVTGVVGRAELLSSMFYLAALLCYARSSKRQSHTNWLCLCLSVVLIGAAMLCKEQGITVVAVCCVYEVIIVQQLCCIGILATMKRLSRKQKGSVLIAWHAVLRMTVLVSCTVLLFFARIHIMGAQLPSFTRFDNPAAAAPSPSRQLTHNYLLPINTWLLLCPSYLCCDWTMGTIPLITSFLDSRNMATLMFYAVFFKLTMKCITGKGRNTRAVIMSLSLIVFPFLPASNLFFPVGFVVAERILYAPSMGFSCLVAIGFHRILKIIKLKLRPILYLCLSILLLSHSLKTVTRNYDWESEYTLFKSALKVNQQNAKLYNNVGHALEHEERYGEALVYFKQAATVQSDDVGAHINVGRTLNLLGDYVGSEAAYRTALGLLPPVKPGRSYTTRMAPNHLSVFLNLGNLLAKNASRLLEADALYRKAIGMRADYVQAYINRGDVLIKLNRSDEARQQYETALTYEEDNADLHYNLGVVLLGQGFSARALECFEKALFYDPHHAQTLFNSAVLMQELGEARYRPEAIRRLSYLATVEPQNEKIFFNLGMLAMDEKQFTEARQHFEQAIKLKEDFRSALFNVALLLSNDLELPLEAEPFLQQLLKFYPNHIKGLLLMGDININHKRDLAAAESYFQRILQQDPRHVAANHNLCVVHVEKGELRKAERCLIDTLTLAPDEAYVKQHLSIVQARIQGKKGDKSQKTENNGR